ncbi:hypothetical protein Tco_1247466 [Tanacetum coccineum]
MDERVLNRFSIKKRCGRRSLYPNRMEKSLNNESIWLTIPVLMFKGCRIMNLVLHDQDIDAARQEDNAIEHRTPPTTTSIFDDEDITMAQTLIKMKEEKAKEKGVSINDVDDSSRPKRSILTLKPLPTIDLLTKLRWLLGREFRLLDYKMEMYRREKDGMYTIEERSKILAEFFKRRKKLLAEERAKRFLKNESTKVEVSRSLRNVDEKHQRRKTKRFSKDSSCENVETARYDVLSTRKKVSLIRETLERMMELRLTAESEGEAVFDLLRFISKTYY